MPKGIKHKDVGNELSYAEFHAEDAHDFAQGTEFPQNPTESELFYRLDLHQWYQFDGSNWVLLTEGPNVRALNASTGSIVITAGDNVTLSQSQGTITIIGAVAEGGIGLAAGNQTVNSGTVTFSDAHDIHFGMANSIVTASYDQSMQPAVSALNASQGSIIIEAGALMSIQNDASYIDIINKISSATTASRVDSANAIGAMQSRFALEGHQHAGLWQVSVGGNTQGQSSAGPGSIFLAAGNNVTLSLQTVQGGESVSIVGNAIPAALGGLGNAQTTYTSGTVLLSAAGNITITSSLDGASQYFKFSAGGGAGGDGVNIIAAGSQTANTTGTILLQNSNSITFGMSNSSVVTASFSQSTHAHSAISGIAAGTQTATSGTIIFSNSNNLTFGMSNSSVVTGSASFNQTVQPAVNLAAGTQTATSGTVVLSNSNNFTFGMSGSSRITASFSESTHAHSAISGIAAGTQTAISGTIVFSNSNNLTFGMSGSTRITGSFSESVQTQSIINALYLGGNTSGALASVSSGILSLYGGNNITLSQNANSITISAPNLGGGGGIALANSQTTFTSGTVTLSAVANISISSSVDGANQYFRFSCPNPGAGTGATDRQFFELIEGERLTTIVAFTATNVSNRIMFSPFWIDVGGLSANTVEFLISGSASSNTASFVVTANLGLYSMNNTSQLTLATSVANALSFSTSSLWNGIGIMAIQGLGGISMSEGRWIMALLIYATGTAHMNARLYGADPMPNIGKWLGSGGTSNTADSKHIVPFWGVYSATTGGLPDSVNLTQINGGASASLVDYYAVIREI